MDGTLIGRITLYIALAWSIYVAIKAAHEGVMTATKPFIGERNVKEKYAHKRAHISGLIGIAAYSLYNIFAYVWFDVEDTGLGTDDRTIGVFNVLFMNVLWLFFIFHFKQERKGTHEKATWWNILKF